MAVSMTKCKKRSMMLLEVKSVWSEKLCGAFEAQRLAWSGVQLPRNRVQLFLRVLAQVAPFWQVLPQQTVGVLVEPSLPGAMRISKVDLYPGGRSQSLMRRHFPTLIVGQRKSRLRFDPIQHMTESTQSRFSAGVIPVSYTHLTLP